jgi:hypothetical protein
MPLLVLAGDRHRDHPAHKDLALRGCLSVPDGEECNRRTKQGDARDDKFAGSPHTVLPPGHSSDPSFSVRDSA